MKWITRVFLFVLSCVLLISCFNTVKADNIDWDIADLDTLGMDNTLLTEMNQVIQEKGSRYSKINSVVIVRKGQLVFENYYNGYNREFLFELCSATKTFTSSLIGIAINKGYIEGVSEKVYKYYPEYSHYIKDPLFKELEIRDLLTMTDGLDWDEGRIPPVELNINPVRYAFSMSFVRKPGEGFNYNSLGPHVLSGVIRKATGMNVGQFADKFLFKPLKIEKKTWPTDPQGNSFGGSGLRLRARDMAKFGQLLLNKGNLNGEQIISPEWIDECIEIHSDGGEGEENYGYLTWLREVNGYNSFCARGYGGQFIYVLPDLDLVVVITSQLDDYNRHHREILDEYIVPAIKVERLTASSIERDIEERVNNLLTEMTLEEKIGQMTQAERSRISPRNVKEMKIGSVLSGGGSVPIPNNPKSWLKMYNNYQKAALDTRLGIPLIYGIDSVHGHNNLKGATIFPHNIGLGATRDPDLVKKMAEITALETAATGLDWSFTPCVAVARDIRWGRTYESFGEDPELQRLLTAAYIKGMQGPDNEMSGRYIVATAKHYIGDGGTSWETGDLDYYLDQGQTMISEEELREIHLPGYIEAIEAGVGSVMVSFSGFQGVKMHEHKYLITDVLKGELGFDGVVVSDWQGVEKLYSLSYYDKVVRAVNAGIDMFMEAYTWKEFIENLKKAVEAGDVSEERINDAVKRILTLKFRCGLFEAPYRDEELLPIELIGSEEHRAVAREAVRKSLVLLKNNNALLPLAKDSTIYIAGSCADNIGYQCGGWTITWQGKSGNITEGTTIKDGMEMALLPEGRITNDIDEADVAVIVVGERPYAEGVGDSSVLSLLTADIKELKKARDSGKPILVIMISGRPLLINNYIADWDAFVAAWLPGTEGQGVADVIFGDYNFTGKLPVTWPRYIVQLPINYGDEEYDPLFKYGVGLQMEL